MVTKGAKWQGMLAVTRSGKQPPITASKETGTTVLKPPEPEFSHQPQ